MESNNVDSGWAWLVLLSCCCIELLYVGFLKALSVLLQTLTDQFETHIWIVGLSISLVASIKDFFSPAVGVLTNYLSHRFLGVTGGLITGCSTLCLLFASNTKHLFVFVSTLNGIGYALVKLPATVILSQYFDKHYALASSLFYASGSIGLIIFAPLTQFLKETYGLRGTVLLLGAISFHLLVCTVLFRTPLHIVKKKYEEKKENESRRKTGKQIKESHSIESSSWLQSIGLDIFTNFAFVAVALTMGSLNAAISGWTVYFVSHNFAKGLTNYESTFSASVAGFTYILGHFIYVPFINRNVISVRSAIYMSGVIAGGVLFFDKFTSSFFGTTVINSFFTCGLGVQCLVDVHMKNIIDNESIAKAFGWRTAVTGLFKPLPAIIVGWIYEKTGSYDGGFFFLSALPLFGVLALGVDHLRERYLPRNETKPVRIKYKQIDTSTKNHKIPNSLWDFDSN